MSRRRKSSPVLPVVLLCACIGLVWVVYQEMGANSRPHAMAGSGEAAPQTVPPLPAAAGFRLAPIERFATVVERPIFSPTRRPADPAAAPTPTPEPEAPVEELALVLKAVIGSADGRIAILSETAGGGTVTLRKGGQYRGWTLAHVLAERVIFRQGEIERQIELKFDAAPAVKQPTRKRRQPNQRRDRRKRTTADN